MRTPIGSFVPKVVVGLLAGMAVLWSCGGDGKAPATNSEAQNTAVQQDSEDQRLRELAAAYFDKDSRAKAREALAPLIERADPAPRDLIAAACIDLSEGNSTKARELLERA